jgi:hypothetical protein
MAEYSKARQEQVQTSATALTYDMVRFLKLPLLAFIRSLIVTNPRVTGSEHHPRPSTSSIEVDRPILHFHGMLPLVVGQGGVASQVRWPPLITADSFVSNKEIFCIQMLCPPTNIRWRKSFTCINLYLDRAQRASATSYQRTCLIW